VLTVVSLRISRPVPEPPAGDRRGLRHGCSCVSERARALRRGLRVALREALGHAPRSRLVALAALAILAVAMAPLTLIAGIAASSAVLVVVAIADTTGQGDRAPRMLG
jgi:thiosulfate reductase cytochrome b subunit